MSGNSHNWLIEVLLSPIGGFFTLWALFRAVEVIHLIFTRSPYDFEMAQSPIGRVVLRLRRTHSFPRP